MRRAFTTAIALGIMCVVFLIISLPDLLITLKEPVDVMEEDDWEDLEKGTHVKTEIDIIWSTFYVETTETRTYGVKTNEYESSRGYMVPKIKIHKKDNDCEVLYFIGMNTGNSKIADKMIDESDEWYEDWQYDCAIYTDYCDTTMEIDGKLRAMTDEEYELAVEYMEEIGMDEDDIEDYLIPLMIVEIDKTTDIIFLIIAIVLALIAIVLVIVGINRKRKEESLVYQPSQYSQQNYNYNAVNNQANTAYGDNTYDYTSSTENYTNSTDNYAGTYSENKNNDGINKDMFN